VFGNPEAKELGEEIKKIDDYTVQIKQSAPNKLLLPVLTIFGIQMLDKQIMVANATADDPWSHKYNNEVNAPGFGAYCLDTWKKAEEFVATANPDYYRGKADIDRIILRRVPQSSTRTIVLRSGQADVAELLTPKETTNLKSVRGVKVAGAWGNRNIAVAMNFKAPPWDNTKLRHAIAHAIPYDKVTENAFFGEARRWESVVPTTYPGFAKTKTRFSFDLGKAKQLHSEAGFADGKGLDAFPAESFQLTYPQERDSWLLPIGTAIQSALNEVGVKI
jgi:peptide/nickel transport system substrate-binding protein